MLVLYVSPSCNYCRKARSWLNVHKIPFKERNIFAQPLEKSELKAILRIAENGTEDILSVRSNIFQTLPVDVEDLSIDQLLELMEANPRLIRRPLIANDRILQVGYDEEEMRRFLPRNERRAKIKRAQLLAEMYHKELWDTEYRNELVR